MMAAALTDLADSACTTALSALAPRVILREPSHHDPALPTSRWRPDGLDPCAAARAALVRSNARLHRHAARDESSARALAPAGTRLVAQRSGPTRSDALPCRLICRRTSKMRPPSILRS